MKDKKHLVQLILAIITFTVLLIFVVNHLHIAFTALIPVFGAFIGLFIGCFLLLVVDPKQVPDDVVPLESAGRRLFAVKSKVEKTDSKKQNKEM